MYRRLVGFLAIALAVTVAGCSSGNSPPTPSFKVGGSVVGLTGTGLVLQDNGGDDLAVNAGAAVFQFATPVKKDGTYAVTVKQQPTSPAQTCTIANATGVATADVNNIAVTCTTDAFAIGGTVTGLAGTGLVLQDNGGDDLTVPAGATSFQFATAVTRNGAYAVTVKQQPSNPAQTCTVSNGTGAATANVADIAVDCSSSLYAVGGSVTGLTGSGLVLHGDLGPGEDLTIPAGATSFTLTQKGIQGTAYNVTIKQQPAGVMCTLANGSGTIGAADVTNVNVACSVNLYSVGGSVSGAATSGLVLHSNIGAGEDLTVNAGASSYTFTNKGATGTSYAVTVKTAPDGYSCTVANGTGTIGSANVTNANVTCSIVPVVQRWQAPATWGGMWPDSTTRVQHAYFNGTTIVEDGGTPSARIGWSVVGGEPQKKTFTGFPSGTRTGAGPFGVGQHYEANAGTDAAVNALTGDMLVCAVLKPDYNPTTDLLVGDDFEKPIIARGEGHDNSTWTGGGWVLMQMHNYFCFHYEYLDAGGQTHLAMAIVPTHFADQNKPNTGPLNPSYVVFCAGRSGNTIHAAVNTVLDVEFSGSSLNLGSGTILLDRGSHPTTIGGYDSSTHDPANHVFPGRIYETAIWNEPATPENIQAKFAAIEGITLAGAKYQRNREAWFLGPETPAALHAVGWNGPRFGTSGLLFGLQGWNRLSHSAPSSGGLPLDVYAPGEDMGLWTVSAGSSVDTNGTVEPPGDSEKTSAKLVTLAAGGSLQTPLGAFEAAGPIHGQLWIQPVSPTGVVDVVVNSGGTSQAHLDLASYTAGQWNRVWLTGLTTDGSAGTVSLQNNGAAPIQFYAWGVDLTQVGTLPTANSGVGFDLGFDPGQLMYDWSSDTDTTGNDSGQFPIDVLQLPAVPGNTTSTGFCLAVDAAMPAGMPWTTPFTRARTAAAWVNSATADPPAATAMIYIDGHNATGTTPNAGKLCFSVTGASPLCANVPASFTAGSAHTIKACMSAGGQMRLYADASTTPIASATTGVAAPNLSGGTMLVGSARAQAVFLTNPWQGYISKAVVCRDTGSPGTCQ